MNFKLFSRITDAALVLIAASNLSFSTFPGRAVRSHLAALPVWIEFAEMVIHRITRTLFRLANLLANIRTFARTLLAFLLLTDTRHPTGLLMPARIGVEPLGLDCITPLAASNMELIAPLKEGARIDLELFADIAHWPLFDIVQSLQGVFNRFASLYFNAMLARERSGAVVAFGRAIG